MKSQASQSIKEEAQQQLALAVPAVMSYLGYQAMNVVDTVMVSGFGAQALAAASLAMLWCFGILVGARGIQRGLDPILSQAFGAQDRPALVSGLLRGLFQAMLLAIPVVLLHLGAGPGLSFLEQPTEIIPLTAQWCRILAIGMPVVLMMGALHAFFQALGQVRIITGSVFVANILHFFLNLLFMYGIGDWPGLGAVGCAWSTVFSDLGMLAMSLFLGRHVLREWWPHPKEREDFWHILKAQGPLLRVGGPIGLQQGLEVWGFSIAGLMAGWLGEVPLAAHMLCLNLASLSFMLPLGIGTAASTRIGHLVGAGQPLGRAAWAAVGMGVGVMSLSGTLFSLFPGFMLSLYHPEATVLATAIILLPIAGAFQLFDGIQGVSFGVLRGAADVRIPALINVVGYYCLGLPLGYFLAFRLDMGVRGIWLGLSLALASIAGLLLLRVRAVVKKGVTRIR